MRRRLYPQTLRNNDPQRALLRQMQIAEKYKKEKLYIGSRECQPGRILALELVGLPHPSWETSHKLLNISEPHFPQLPHF